MGQEISTSHHELKLLYELAYALMNKLDLTLEFLGLLQFAVGIWCTLNAWAVFPRSTYLAFRLYYVSEIGWMVSGQKRVKGLVYFGTLKKSIYIFGHFSKVFVSKITSLITPKPLDRSFCNFNHLFYT